MIHSRKTLVYPRRMRRLLAFLLLAGAACGDSKYRAIEAWKVAPEIRVAGMLSPSRQTARALASGAQFEVSIAQEAERGQAIELWMFSYAIADLVEQYPGLEGKSAQEIAEQLRPSFTAGLAAPVAAEVIMTSVDPAGSQDLTYVPSTWDAWTTKGATLYFDVPDEIACSAFDFSSFQGPPGIRLEGVTLIDDNRAIYAGSALAAGAEAMQLWISDRDTFSDLGPRTNRAPLRGTLSWDLTSSSGYGTDSEGGVFRFDDDGADLPVTQHTYLYEVSVGRDGTLRGAGPGRVIYELDGNAWRLLDPERTSPAELLRMVRRDDFYAFSVCWVSHWDGREWGNPELFDPACNTMMGRRTTLQDVAAGPEGAMGVGTDAFISIRDESTGKWAEQHPEELSRSDLTRGAVLARGHYAVGGAGGLLAVNQGARWCPFINAEAGEIVAMAASPSGNVAYAIGTTAAGSRSRTTILKVSLRQR